MSFLESVGSLFGWFQGPVRNNGPHSPSYEDICEVRAVLKAYGLPTELIWHILDYAEYIPQHVFSTSPDQAKLAAARMGRPSHACLCVDAGIFNNTTVNPIRKGYEQPKVKDISFEIASHDQGWTSENTHGSYETSSWLEVSILRSMDENNTRLPGPPFVNVWISNPSDFQQGVSERGWYLVKRPPEAEQGPQGGEGDFAWYLQGNRVARPQPEDGYRVKWTADGYEGNQGAGSGLGFIRELKDGDRILIWARAKWPGWKCAVDSIKVTVRYDTNR